MCAAFDAATSDEPMRGLLSRPCAHSTVAPVHESVFAGGGCIRTSEPDGKRQDVALSQPVASLPIDRQATANKVAATAADAAGRSLHRSGIPLPARSLIGEAVALDQVPQVPCQP